MKRTEGMNAKKPASAAGKPAGNTFFSMTVVQSRLLLLQFGAYLGSIFLVFRAYEKLEPFIATHSVLSFLFAFGIPFYLLTFSAAPQFWQRHQQARRNAIALTPNPALPIETRYFRLDQYVMPTPEEFQRDDGAHRHVLAWIRDANRPILFLSGVSGAGKSSVLDGYVLPMLEKENLRIERIRSNADPLPQLQAILATRRPKASRLLIVFDQFEEFIILEDLTSAEARRQFIDCIRELRQSPPPGLCLLFAFRRDYMSEMISMEIDELVPGKSFMEIDTFKRLAARRFFEKAFNNPALIERLLAGAEQLDDVPARFRPVTLNMLGIALQDFDQEVSRQPERLVQGYMEAAISQPDIRDIAPQVVMQMISEVNTKRPCTVAELSTTTHLAKPDILACLILLEQKGLARRLDAGSGLWELSHDFVARQLGLLLGRMRPNRWPTIGMSVMSGLFVIILTGAVIGMPKYLKGQALAELASLQVGFVNHNETGLTANFDTSATNETVIDALPYLSQLGINSINLSYSRVTKLPSLDKLTALQSLDLTATGVRKLPSLDKLTGLKVLDLSRSNVSTLPSLDKLTALQVLVLRSTDVSTLPSLDKLTALKILDISHSNVNRLPSLDKLTSLEILGLGNTDVDTLPSLDKLTALKSLDLSRSKVSTLPPLDKLTALQSLDITHTEVTSIPPTKNRVSIIGVDGRRIAQ